MSKVEIVRVTKEKGFVAYEKVDIDTYFGRNSSAMKGGAVKGERALTHSFVMDVLRKVMGKTLTIIDASVHDKTQNKAIKDLLRSVISEEMEFAAEWGFDQKVLTRMGEEYYREMSDEEIENSAVSIEEALGVE